MTYEEYENDPMLKILAERWKQGHRYLYCNGNPGRVPKPSRALAPSGKARLRLRDHGNRATRNIASC
jgi:hypothetical protein